MKTKKERNAIYKKALKKIETDFYKYSHAGLCYAMSRAAQEYIYHQFNYKKETDVNFPELWYFIEEERPKLNWHERKTILQFCIEMTND